MAALPLVMQRGNGKQHKKTLVKGEKSKIEQKTSPSHENRGYGQFDAIVSVDVFSNSPIFVGRCTRKRRGWAAAAT